MGREVEGARRLGPVRLRPGALRPILCHTSALRSSGVATEMAASGHSLKRDSIRLSGMNQIIATST